MLRLNINDIEDEWTSISDDMDINIYDNEDGTLFITAYPVVDGFMQTDKLIELAEIEVPSRGKYEFGETSTFENCDGTLLAEIAQDTDDKKFYVQINDFTCHLKFDTRKEAEVYAQGYFDGYDDGLDNHR